MKISILNESFFTDGHLEQLRALGEVVIHENTASEDQVIERLQDADIAIADCYNAPLNKKVLESTTSLKLLAINSTGYDLVDTEAAAAQGIKVANVPGFSTEAVAEQVFALLLALSRKIPAGNAAMRKAPFQIDPASQTERSYLGFDLKHKTLGIIGLGSIGQRVAEIAHGFGMKVIAYNRSTKNIAGITQVSLEELLQQSDIVSLHVPLTSETENILNEQRLALMKPSAILINTSRGKCVDEAALYSALQSHKLAGAGLDVLNDWSPSNLLLTLENAVFSPHSAFFTTEALQNCADIIVTNIKSFIEGKPINIVN